MNKMKAILSVASYIALIIIAVIECIVVVFIIDCSSITDYLVVAFIVSIGAGFSGYAVHEAYRKLKLKKKELNESED